MLKYKNIVIFFSLCLLASCISPAGRREELTKDFQTLMPGFRELSIHRPMKANAIFDGGGIKAIASVGALKAAEDNGFQFVRVAGTSSGSLVAALYAAGYTSEELLHILATTDFMQFLRYKKPTPLYLFLHLSELKKDLGYYSTDLLYEWVKELLEAKNVRYFKDLKIPLRVVVADVLNRRRTVFSTEDNPDMLVADALRYSMSIPIFFRPVNFNIERGNQQFLLDGAIIESYPVDIFSDGPNKSIPTFGLRLFDSEEEMCTHRVKDVMDYITQIIKTATVYHEKKEAEQMKSVYGINISVGNVRNIDFDLTAKERINLYLSGYNTANEFLKNWRKQYYEKKILRYKIRIAIIIGILLILLLILYSYRRYGHKRKT